MLKKLSIFVLLTVSASVVGVAQQAPESRAQFEKRIGISFNGGSYLGVQTQEISKENFAKFGLSEVRGVAVEKVVENSPAAQAGLQNADVIISFNGEEVSSVRKLTRLISEIAPDHKANLVVSRGGIEREISVTLGKREIPNFEMSRFPTGSVYSIPAVPALPPRTPLPPMNDSETRSFVWRLGERRQIGIDVTPLTKQLGDFFGVASGKGLLIDSVRADSPAARGGLRAGDVIVEADGKEVGGNLDLIRIINEKKEGDVNLTIVREKNRQTIRITPEISKDNLNLQNFDQFENFGEGFAPKGDFKMTLPATPSAPRTLISPRVL